MALPSSGILSLSDVAAEFGGSTPHGLNEYYGAASGVPSSGAIALSDFYGASAGVQYIGLALASFSSTAGMSLAYPAGTQVGDVCVATVASFYNVATSQFISANGALLTSQFARTSSTAYGKMTTIAFVINDLTAPYGDNGVSGGTVFGQFSLRVFRGVTSASISGTADYGRGSYTWPSQTAVDGSAAVIHACCSLGTFTQQYGGFSNQISTSYGIKSAIRTDIPAGSFNTSWTIGSSGGGTEERRIVNMVVLNP